MVFQVESIHRSKLNIVLCRARSVASVRLFNFAGGARPCTPEKDEDSKRQLEYLRCKHKSGQVCRKYFLLF